MDVKTAREVAILTKSGALVAQTKCRVATLHLLVNADQVLEKAAKSDDAIE